MVRCSRCRERQLFAGGEVLLVVAAHLGREAGNVVAPAGQNLAYDGINALTHK